jgi:hypothetical protein
MICMRAMYQSVKYARGLHSGTLVLEVSARLARFERDGDGVGDYAANQASLAFIGRPEIHVLRIR